MLEAGGVPLSHSPTPGAGCDGGLTLPACGVAGLWRSGSCHGHGILEPPRPLLLLAPSSSAGKAPRGQTPITPPPRSIGGLPEVGRGKLGCKA